MSPSSEEKESFRDEVELGEFRGEFGTDARPSESVSKERLVSKASGVNL